MVRLSFICAFVVALTSFTVAAEKTLIMCKNGKPDGTGLVGKFLSCMKDASKEGKLARCAINKMSGVPNNPDTALTTILGYLPKDQREMAKKELVPCMKMFPKIKPVKNDPEGDTCKPIGKCVSDLYNNKLCKK